MTEILKPDGSAPDLSDHIRAARCINSVAHNLNNHLAAISGRVELLKMEERISSETMQMYDDILACVHKSSQLIESLAGTLAVRQTRVSLVDIFELVQQTIDLHHFEAHKERIAIVVHSRGDCSPIPAIRGRLSRALMIILRDAIERVRRAERRSISIDIQGEEDAVVLVIRDSSDTLPEWRADLGCAGPEGVQDPNSLLSALEHVRFHRGELTFEAEKGLVLRLPRSNGLTEGEQVTENSACADAGRQAAREG